MIRIQVKDNTEEGFKKAMSKFNRICKKENFIYEIKQRRYFRKPSEIRREKRNKAIRRSQRNG